MKILGFAGFSGSGKTTLVTNLIPLLIERGYRISTIKHTHHSVFLDGQGEHSLLLRQAGVHELILANENRWSMVHENRTSPEPSVEELADLMDPVDLLVIEGFKRYPHAKIEVHRPALEKPLLCPDDPNIIAVASDAHIPALDRPQLDLNNLAKIADFIETRILR
ncbi:MAG: molybdopterin-guanine dinucleotide biosynthesis protein B [Pseudomonadota bacterium]